MYYAEKKALSKARIKHAEENLSAAKILLDAGYYRNAASFSYYTVFHAMRAVLAFDDIDMKQHSGVIAEFHRLYIETGVFESDLSQIISVLFEVRTGSDYDDFFEIEKDEAVRLVENAKHFLESSKNFLSEKCAPPVPDMSKLTPEQLDAELEKGYADVLAGRCKPAQEVFAELWKELGL